PGRPPWRPTCLPRPWRSTARPLPWGKRAEDSAYQNGAAAKIRCRAFARLWVGFRAVLPLRRAVFLFGGGVVQDPFQPAACQLTDPQTQEGAAGADHHQGHGGKAVALLPPDQEQDKAHKEQEEA